MRLRTFTAPNMQRAMVMIREAMGDDAIIVSSSRDAATKMVNVTVALEEEDEALMFDEFDVAPPVFQPPNMGRHAMPDTDIAEIKTPEAKQAEPTAAQERDVEKGASLSRYLAARDAVTKKTPEKKQETAKMQEEKLSAKGRFVPHEGLFLLNEIESIFQFHGLPPALIDKYLQAARTLDLSYSHDEKGVADALAHVLFHICHFSAIDLPRKPDRLLLIGTPGAGKTMAVAKMAAQLVRAKKPVHICSVDVKRAGGVEQLQAFTTILGLETHVAETRAELRQWLKETPPDESVLVDCFGCNPYSFDELKELNEFSGLYQIEPVLVQPAGGDAQEAADASGRFSFMGVKRLLVSRMDVARRFGLVFSVTDSGGLALGSVTFSPQVANGIKPFSASALAEMLMQHRR